MKKKDQILMLIEADITISKLIITLHDIHVDADKYYTDISIVVFVLMGLKEQQRTDDLYGIYFDMVRQVRYLDLSIEGECKKLATKIYDCLTAKT